jgi:hypothetical protein
MLPHDATEVRDMGAESAGASTLLLVYKGSLTPRASVAGLAPPVELLNISAEGLPLTGGTAAGAAGGVVQAPAASAAEGITVDPDHEVPDLAVEASLAPDSATFGRSPDPAAYENDHDSTHPSPLSPAAAAPGFILSSFPHLQPGPVVVTSVGGSSVTSSGTGGMSDQASHSLASSMGGGLAMSSRGSGASAYAMRPRSPAHPAGSMSPTPRSQQLRVGVGSIRSKSMPCGGS